MRHLQKYWRTVGFLIAWSALGTGCNRPASKLAPVADKSAWLTNYAQAQAEAKTKQKLLLLDFTGSDWCTWCIKLKREVFETAEFKDYARKNLILLAVDFPRMVELSAEQKTQNEQLAQQFQIEGFPTIVVLNGEGRMLGALGYTRGGPAAFITELEKIRDI